MNQLLKDLHQAVSRRRCAGSNTEMQYVAQLCTRLPVTMIDEAGNLYIDLRTKPEHRTLFTCHSDTVHHDGGKNSYKVDGQFWRADGDVLGADDGAGLALVMHMIDHHVPGLYIVFRAEEAGGIGSNFAAENMHSMFANIDRAIAFDRAGYHDVITHQVGGRCCSEEFATALAEALTNEEFTLAYAPCDRGVFTDTANLTSLIPECTNVSVGYFHQHSEREHQDVAFLQLLADKVVTIDWDALPVQHKSEDLSLFDALTEALDGNQTALRVLMTKRIGDEYKYYIDRLHVDQQTVEDAYQMALAMEPTFQILDFLLGECSVT